MTDERREGPLTFSTRGVLKNVAALLAPCVSHTTFQI
jgi:hypothetical protein